MHSILRMSASINQNRLLTRNRPRIIVGSSILIGPELRRKRHHLIARDVCAHHALFAGNSKSGQAEERDAFSSQMDP